MAVGAIVKYSLIRLLLFAVPFGLMFWAGWDPVISAIVAAVFAGLASYIFFNRQQTQVADEVAARRQRRRERLGITDDDLESGPTDEDEEDALLGDEDPLSDSAASPAEPVSGTDTPHPAAEPTEDATDADTSSETDARPDADAGQDTRTDR